MVPISTFRHLSTFGTHNNSYLSIDTVPHCARICRCSFIAFELRRLLFSPFDNKRVSTYRKLVCFFIVRKLCSFSFSLIRKGCSHSIRRFQFVQGSPQKRFRDLVATQVLLSVSYEHLSLCIPYYMNVIPTNLKVRFVSKIRLFYVVAAVLVLVASAMCPNGQMRWINCWLNKPPKIYQLIGNQILHWWTTADVQK